MSIEELVVEKLRELPPDKQQEAVRMVESLKDTGKDTGPVKPLRSGAGLWAGMGFDITEEDIAEARREMWGNFPRDIEL
jgi:hypothetical protein